MTLCEASWLDSRGYSVKKETSKSVNRVASPGVGICPASGEGIVKPMRCSTCGEALRSDEERCPTCGAAVAHLHLSVSVDPRESLHECPRCKYRGDAIPYFRRVGPVALLVGLSLFTYGIGGVVYWAARRKHRVCPQCGLGWEFARTPALPAGARAPTTATVTPRQAAPPQQRARPPVPPKIPGSGIVRRVLGSATAILGTVLITTGIVALEPGAVLAGTLTGAVGSGMFYWGWKALQRRRKAVMLSLAQRVLLMAGERDGVLTVTEVATELNLSIAAAEKLLLDMDDGLRVRSEVSDEGVIFFEFPELRHQKKLREGDPA